MKDLDAYYTQQIEPIRGCLLTLRDIILSQDREVSETRKWNMPCFCYKEKMFCFLWIDKKSNLPYILFVEGKHLNEPLLKTQKRSRMKALYLDPCKDIPLELIAHLLTVSLDLSRSVTL